MDKLRTLSEQRNGGFFQNAETGCDTCGHVFPNGQEVHLEGCAALLKDFTLHLMDRHAKLAETLRQSTPINCFAASPTHWACCPMFLDVEKAGVILATETGYSVTCQCNEEFSGVLIDLTYCPFCGTKLPEVRN